MSSLESIEVGPISPDALIPLSDQVRGLEAGGKGLVFPGRTRNAVSVAASRVRNEFKDRVFVVRQTDDGPGIWRLV